MTLTEQEIQRVKEIFYLDNGEEFDVYHRVGNNHELGSIDVPSQFEPSSGNFKTTIMNGKLIVVILSHPDTDYTYIGEPYFLTPGLGL